MELPVFLLGLVSTLRDPITVIAEHVEAELVKFSPLGTHFAVLYPKKIEVYSLTLKLLHTLSGGSRFNTLEFALLPVDEDEADQEVLCVGTEKGTIEVYTIELSAPVEDEEEEEDEDEQENGESSAKVGSGAEVEKIGVLTGHTNR